jgi:aminotransferase/cystathionine beta-lyase
MNYDFTSRLNRRNQGSDKWDLMYKKNPQAADNVVPLSVADMELKNPPEIVQGLKDYLDSHVLGYTHPTESYYKALRGWMQTRHNWAIQDSWVLQSPGVVPAFYMATGAFTQPGDGVIIMPPVYHPFRGAVEANERRLVTNPLKLEGSHYSIDYEDLEKKASDPRNNLLIFCSPHNPVGRVWTKEELQKLAAICNRNHVLVVADEIHSDLILPGFHHTVYASLDKETEQNCIICTAPSKTFSIPGLATSNIIIPNKEIREKYKAYMQRNALGSVNVLGLQACEIAYSQCAAWLDKLLGLLKTNYDLIFHFMARNFPEVRVFPLEGSYLVWADFRAWGLSPEGLEDFMVNKAQLFLDEGYVFGDEGKGFERIAIACPTEVIQEALERLLAARKNI